MRQSEKAERPNNRKGKKAAKTGIFETCRRAREGRIAKRFSGGRPSSRRSMFVFPPVRSVVGVSLSAPRSGALVKTSSRLNAKITF